MKKSTRELRDYCRRINALLPCDGRQRREIMGKLRDSFEEYRRENRVTDTQQIIEHFGTPEEVAEAYLQEMDTQEVLKALRVRKRLTVLIMAAFAAALLVWGVAAFHVTANRQISGGSSHTSIYVVEGQLPGAGTERGEQNGQ